MFDKHFIGQNAAGITAAPQFAPISKIVLLVDDDNSYVAGDDTGRELELTCPYGSQVMANTLLSQLRGYAYSPMTAQDALLDPAAELGDGVTVGGVYTVLAHMDTLFDMHCAADIAAPGEDEVESEYTYQSPEKRLERQLAQARSLIAKTAEEVNISVGALTGKYTALSLTLDGLTVTDEEGTTKIKGSSIETDTLYVQAAHITGKLKASQINADNLEVDAANIYGTLVAQELQGEEVTLLDVNGEAVGRIKTGEADTADNRIELEADGALYLRAVEGAVYIEQTDGAHILLDGAATMQGDGGAYIEVDDAVSVQGDLLPHYTERYWIGDSDNTWNRVYSMAFYADNEQITSDRNKKHDIDYNLSKYETLFDSLRPAGYKLNNGTSGRVHIGMIAQDVEQCVTACGLSGLDFGAVVRDVTKSGAEHYYLRYAEFIGLLIDQVQKLKARVARLEGRNCEV